MDSLALFGVVVTRHLVGRGEVEGDEGCDVVDPVGADGLQPASRRRVQPGSFGAGEPAVCHLLDENVAERVLVVSFHGRAADRPDHLTTDQSPKSVAHGIGGRAVGEGDRSGPEHAPDDGCDL